MKKYGEALCSLKTTRRFRETRKETETRETARVLGLEGVVLLTAGAPTSRGQFPRLLTGLGKQPVTRATLPRASTARTALRQMRLGDRRETHENAAAAETACGVRLGVREAKAISEERLRMRLTARHQTQDAGLTPEPRPMRAGSPVWRPESTVPTSGWRGHLRVQKPHTEKE